MWLDDREVVLDEIILKCKDIYRNYKSVINLTDDSTLAHLFEELANQRKYWIVQLESHMHKIGGLPSDIDPEKQALETLVTRTKVALSDDERNTILKEREKEEEELKILIKQALKQNFPGDTKSFLRRIEEEIEETQRLLLATHSKQ